MTKVLKRPKHLICNESMSLIVKNLLKTSSNLKQFLSSIRFIRSDYKRYQISENDAQWLEPQLLEQDNEDVSSLVRYNRKLISPKVEHFQQLYKDDPTLKLNIELICAEFELIRLTNHRIKHSITVDDMKQLLELGPIGRQNFFNSLYLKDTRKMRSKLNKIIKKKNEQNNNETSDNKQTIDRASIGIFDQNGQIVYGLWRNALFTRILYPKNQVIINRRHRNAFLFGQNLVIDWNSDFESGLHKNEIRKMLTQVSFVYNNNRYRYSDPYSLHFCNINPNSIAFQYLSITLQKFGQNDFYVNMSEKSYSQLFPQQNIIYITSHAEEVLETYDYNAVYVISPLLERRAEKAKNYLKERLSEENVKYLRLPFEKHIKLKDNRFICMNQWLDCMNDVKNGDSWKEAFERHLPRRKVIQSIDEDYENAQKLIKKRKLDFDLFALKQELN